ncbi:MAG: hypothetical protein JO316_04720 [Abitibacteriaceae bacterium]|nr:hypothetical protein [Abditibacteriaceae bacterium]
MRKIQERDCAEGQIQEQILSHNVNNITMLYQQHQLKLVNPSHALPTFHKGQRVQVILNERNTTPRSGLICEIGWHRARHKFYYHIEADGQCIVKRYYSDDLRSLD